MGHSHSRSKNSSNPSFNQIKSVQTSSENRKKNNSTNNSSSTDKPIQFVENLLLCWLDASSDKDTDQQTLNQFYRVTHIVQTFTDLETCFAFLQSLTNVTVLFVVSGSFGSQILPRIEHFEHIYSIYIFCGNKANHIEWTKPYKKIKGIHTQIKDLTESLQYDANQYDKRLTSFSILPQGPIRKIDQTNANFLYLHIIKSCILQMNYDKKSVQESIDYCQKFYSNQGQQLHVINTFESNYQVHSPIWWYTRKCFLYYMLRRAFLTSNYQIMHKLAFSIRDLHHDIKKTHDQAHNHQITPINVYRSTKITFEQYRNLEENNDGLLSFDDFVLTILERSIALKFAQKLRNDVHSIAIIFKIHIDPVKTTMPFTVLNNLKYLSDANGEILLSMNTIFRIDVIEKIFDRLYEITLIPAREKDEQVIKLVNFMQNFLTGPSIYYKFSRFLLEVKQYDEAENIYKQILNQLDENQREERAFLFHELAYVYDLKNHLDQSILFYQRALDLYNKYLLPGHPILFSTYINLASVLQKQGDLRRANEQCQRAFEVLKISESNRIIAYNTQALILQQQRNFSEAEQIFKKALEISSKDLPSADTYHNVGNFYYQQRDYTRAIYFYEKAIEIEKTLNSNSLSITYYNLATAYENLNNWQKAIEYAEQAIEKARLIYGNNHQETKENLQYLEYLQLKSSPPSSDERF